MNIKRMRLEILGDINDTSKDTIFKIKLDDAKSIALNTLFPYDLEVEELPNTFRMNTWLVRCAIELYNNMGNENVSSYSENGIAVTFKEGTISTKLLNELIPRAGRVSKNDKNKC